MGITEHLKLLENRLPQIDVEDEVEEYILTPEEEVEALRHAVETEIKNFVWKRVGKGENKYTVERKSKETDWENKINKDELFKQANSRKHRIVWERQQREKEREQETGYEKELREKCNTKYAYNLMAWASKNVYGKPLIFNEYNSDLIRAACYFTSEDEKFETELKFSFKKGLLVRGKSGLGKTHVVKCLEQHELNPILVLSMIDITDSIRENGDFIMDMKGKKMVYLDDVGTEETIVNYFGSKISYFKDFIEKVYLRNKTFNKLIVSTNLNFAQIEEKYGFRVRSRMEEMFNVIDVSGQDMRKR